MLLGTPLAAYGGWKAVDAVLDKQRRAKSEDNLDEAKKDYEEALLASYKKSASTDEMLDEVFDNYKEASTLSDILGTGKGLALTYALATGPLGYMMVNSQMKKNSKRKILEKAMRVSELDAKQLSSLLSFTLSPLLWSMTKTKKHKSREVLCSRSRQICLGPRLLC